MPTRPRRSSKTRPRRWALRLGAILAAALVLTELSLRFLLFVDFAPARSLSKRLRSAPSLAAKNSVDYWKLRLRFRNPEAHAPPNRFDPLLGWRNHNTHPGTYDHDARAALAGRRPVLLYGDSFAQCTTGAEGCWQGLLERSDLGPTHALINYGVGGYGFDQACMLLFESLPLWVDLDPIVILSVLVDDDMDRALLPLRGWPKPTFRLGPEGELIPPAPVRPGAYEYLRANPVGPRSYLLSYLTHGTQLLPDGMQRYLSAEEEREGRVRALTSALLQEARGRLEAAQVEYFVLLFHGRRNLRRTDWRTEFLEAELGRLAMPFVSSLAAFESRSGQGDADDWFVTKGRGKGHYTEAGNAVVFEALRWGIEGRFDNPVDR